MVYVVLVVRKKRPVLKVVLGPKKWDTSIMTRISLLLTVDIATSWHPTTHQKIAKRYKTFWTGRKLNICLHMKKTDWFVLYVAPTLEDTMKPNTSTSTRTQTCQKVEERKRNLVLQQTMFKKAISQNEAAVKASFIMVAEITNQPDLSIREHLLKNAC